MILRIAIKEIREHLLTLMFSISMVFIVMLVVVGTMAYIQGNKEKLKVYQDYIKSRNPHLRGTIESTAMSPNFFYKRPSPREFCAVEDVSIWRPLISQLGSSTIIGEGIECALPWAIDYYGRGSWLIWEGLNNLFTRYEWDGSLPKALRIDWAFIVGVLGSLIAMLFTYDAISGEKEKGTLRLLLSNQISRSSILIGKFLGSIATLSIAFGFGWLISIIILSSFGIISLKRDGFTLLFMVPLLSLLFLSLFSFLGLLLSSIFRSSSSALLTLLTIWVVFIVLMPGISSFYLRIVEGNFRYEDVFTVLARVKKEVDMKYKDGMDRIKEKMNDFSDKEVVSLLRGYMGDMERISSEVDKEFDKVLFMVERGRRWARLSPAMLYRYSLEALAGTGFPGHKEFIMQVRRFSRDLLSYLKKVDMEDPNSPHIFWVRGGMSEREIEIPLFTHDPKLSWAIRESMWDNVTLLVLGILIFLLSYLAFMRADVR